ncbi:MAG: S-methyl-5-thioribose-1-phosphate isomerase [Candidatus Methanomethylicia archaeon]|jgi:methylthioribose-1-phosphate isomerase|nr:S-methyl-5-thioribose-1-phosphate isomerase [Candidatus Methanomethylicia archaeon]
MKTIEWREDGVYIIDQTKLPHQLVLIKCEDYERIAIAIERMEIRGAPAIGVAAAMGVALAAKKAANGSLEEIKKELDKALRRLQRTRPTARNLFWALERMKSVWSSADSPSQIVKKVVDEAIKISEEDVAACRAIGKFGAELISDGDRILTHCNAGGLACVEYGTALGVIRAAHESGKEIFVYASETRPLLQGARLTAFELKTEGIPFKLITDNMAAHLMQRRLIDKVIVGADRITRDGCVFNKIGTYGLAILAKAHGLPFYVAAPVSTIDLNITPDRVIIEERDPNEVLYINNVRIAPEGTKALNPAFDMTPGELVSAIITDKGVAHPPYDLSLLLR